MYIYVLIIDSDIKMGCFFIYLFYFIVFLGVKDVSSSELSQRKEAWESQRKVYTSEFIEIDPCMVRMLHNFFFPLLLK